jgi:hypothetical protein
VNVAGAAAAGFQAARATGVGQARQRLVEAAVLSAAAEAKSVVPASSTPASPPPALPRPAASRPL